MVNKPLKTLWTLLTLTVVLGAMAACSNVVPPPNAAAVQGQWPQYEYPWPEGGG